MIRCQICHRRWVRLPTFRAVGCPSGHGWVTDLEMEADRLLATLIGELVNHE